MIISIGIILAIYCILILSFSIGFAKVKNFNKTVSNPLSKFSIVIPFRDESENLPELLQSLSLLNYPKDLYEILFVDDDSEDDSVAILKKGVDFTQTNSTILKNNRISKSPKKDAIETAIAQAQFEWILTTDADCSVPKDWLTILDAFIQEEQPKMIAAPVGFTSNDSLLSQFQVLDFLALQATTIGAFGIEKPFLCNGANLCYKKDAFITLNGFTGNKHMASGDDIFLLEKMIASYPNKVKFLKSNKAVVRTKPEFTLTNLISQRVRWAAKSTAYSSSFAKLVGLTVLSINSVLIFLLLGSVLGYFSWIFFGFIYLLKFSVDFILLFQMASFINQKRNLIHTVWVAILYPIFSIFIVLKSFTSEYSWKGRNFKK